MPQRSPLRDLPRGGVLVLGALAAARAVGLVLIMSALASALADLAAQRPLDTAMLLGWGLAGTVLRAGGAWGSRVSAARLAVGVKERLRAELVQHRLASGSTAGDAEAAALASRGLDGLDPYFRDYLPAVISCAVVPLLVGVRILAADWVSALVIVLTIPLVPLFMALVGWYTQERVERAQAGLDRLGRHLSELAAGLPVLVGLRRAEQQRRALADVSERHRGVTMATLRTAFLSAFVLELIASLSVAVVAVFIGVRLVNGSMGLEAGLVALMLAPECFAALREVGSGHHASEDGVAALRRVQDALQVPVAAEVGRTGARVLTVAGLRVQRADRPEVGPVSLTAGPGEVTALVGPSGCGKSTVLGVLAGTVRSEGSTGVSGDVTGVDPAARAAALQAPRFAETSAREELEAAGGTEVLALLLRASAWDESLAGLSPGERRRVAVARAVTRARAELARGGRALLLLDEPTAHLDAVSASRVRALVDDTARRGATVLVATHDVAWAATAARTVRWRADGTVVTTAGKALSGTATLHDAAGSAAAAALLASGAGPEGGATELEATGLDATGLAPIGQDGAGQDRTGQDRTGRVGSEDAASEKAGAGRGDRGRWRSLIGVLPLGSPRLWLAMLLGAAAMLSASALSAVSGWLIVEASTKVAMMYLMVAIVGVRFFGLARATLRFCERLVTHDVVLRWAGEWRVRLWDALGADARGWCRLTAPGGALGTLIAEVDELRDAMPRVLVPLPAAALACAATAVTVGLVAPGALPVTLAVVLLGLLVLPAMVLGLERRAARASAEHRADTAERTGRVLAAAPDLVADGAAVQAGHRFAEADRAAAGTLRRDAFGAGAGQGLAALLVDLGALFAIVTAPATDARLLTLAVLALLALQEPLGQAVEAARHLPVLTAMLARVAPWADLGDRRGSSVSSDGGAGGGAQETASPTPGASSAVTAVTEDVADATEKTTDARPTLRGVRAVDLAAGYGERPVFTHVDGETGPGRTWAVTGPSGSGKSTLVATLLGFLTPMQGRVEVRRGDGDFAERREDEAGIAWCPQDGYVFDSTVRGNLALARARSDPPSDAEMTAALRRVGLGPLLAALPDGLDTRTGAGGTELSGGQRQRLAVARTLLSGAGVVVLDEPTAHLGRDEGHELVADARHAAGETALVLVTHDAELAAEADLVTVLGERDRVEAVAR